MVSVASLLNPIPQSFERYRELPTPYSSEYTPDPSPPLPPIKKQKMSKDAAVFAKGKTKGELRYPPCEIQTEEIAAQHEKFRVFPMGHIANYCRHIPYNSDKKSFLEKTGRESFEGKLAYGRDKKEGNADDALQSSSTPLEHPMMTANTQ